MGLRIQNNIEAFNTHRQLTATATQASKSMEKLSSGYRINRAADDAAGLAISEKMRGQIGGLAQAQRNAQDGISLVQTAEGALGEVHSMLQRVRDLKVQFDNGTLTPTTRTRSRSEVVADRQGDQEHHRPTTKFNGKTVFGTGDVHVPGRRQRRRDHHVTTASTPPAGARRRRARRVHRPRRRRHRVVGAALASAHRARADDRHGDQERLQGPRGLTARSRTASSTV